MVGSKLKVKSFEIDKRLVYGAWVKVQAVRPLGPYPTHRRPTCGSRMTGDCHVRFCESRGVRLPPATYPHVQRHHQQLARPAAHQPPGHRRADRRHRNTKGLTIRTELDTNTYPRGIKVSNTEMAEMTKQLSRNKVHGERYLSSQVRQFDGQLFCSSGWGSLIQDCLGIFGGVGRRANRSGCAA